MATERVIVDAGPLVAILNRLDTHHQSCKQTGVDLTGPFLTTWPVITEAAWLLRKTLGGVSGLLRMISEGLIECHPLPAEAALWIDAFFKKYHDQLPQIADASLMYLAEKENVQKIFTLDRRDFSVYRLSNNRAVTLVP